MDRIMTFCLSIWTPVLPARHAAPKKCYSYAELADRTHELQRQRHFKLPGLNNAHNHIRIMGIVETREL